jgi:hypothetical protein
VRRTPTPLTFVAFDVMSVDGTNVMGLRTQSTARSSTTSA